MTAVDFEEKKWVLVEKLRNVKKNDLVGVLNPSKLAQQDFVKILGMTCFGPCYISVIFVPQFATCPLLRLA